MALEAYLSGNWNETERIARAILRRNRRDPDTILLLATLCRHAERYAEAAAWLDRLETLETAEKWAEEIAFERAELAEAAAGEEEEDAPPEVIPLPAREEENRGPAERRRAVGR